MIERSIWSIWAIKSMIWSKSITSHNSWTLPLKHSMMFSRNSFARSTWGMLLLMQHSQVIEPSLKIKLDAWLREPSKQERFYPMIRVYFITSLLIISIETHWLLYDLEKYFNGVSLPIFILSHDSHKTLWILTKIMLFLACFELVRA